MRRAPAVLKEAIRSVTHNVSDLAVDPRMIPKEKRRIVEPCAGSVIRRVHRLFPDKDRCGKAIGHFAEGTTKRNAPNELAICRVVGLSPAPASAVIIAPLVVEYRLGIGRSPCGARIHPDAFCPVALSVNVALFEVWKDCVGVRTRLLDRGERGKKVMPVALLPNWDYYPTLGFVVVIAFRKSGSYSEPDPYCPTAGLEDSTRPTLGVTVTG
jgi:hypothetical protein